MLRSISLRVPVLILGAVLAGCGNGSRILPPASLPPSITSISPTSGTATGGTAVTIFGSGFEPGASVSVGGVGARVTGLSSNSIVVITVPVALPGPVDIVVANPDGQRTTLLRGFTYVVDAPEDAGELVLTATPSLVVTNGELILTWTGPRATLTDWIGLFRVEDMNSRQVWATWASDSGRFSLPAPTEPGEYEFRYLPNEGLSHVARSNTVTVVRP